MLWMSKTEKTLDDLTPVFGDPQVIEVELAKHKVRYLMTLHFLTNSKLLLNSISVVMKENKLHFLMIDSMYQAK